LPRKLALEDARQLRAADELGPNRVDVCLFASLDNAAWMRRGSASNDMVSVRALAWIIAGHTLDHYRSLRQQSMGCE